MTGFRRYSLSIAYKIGVDTQFVILTWCAYHKRLSGMKDLHDSSFVLRPWSPAYCKQKATDFRVLYNVTLIYLSKTNGGNTWCTKALNIPGKIECENKTNHNKFVLESKCSKCLMYLKIEGVGLFQGST